MTFEAERASNFETDTWARGKLQRLAVTTTEILQSFEPYALPAQDEEVLDVSNAEASSMPWTDPSMHEIPLRGKKVEHNGESMSMTREEMMAHLDAQQARTEAMLARQNADTVGHLARFEAQIDRGLAQMQVDRQDQKDEARTVRWTVISSTLAIFLALVGTIFAIVSLNSSVVSNVISSFQAGLAAGPSKPVDAPQQASGNTANSPPK